jgi:hypothetical protein
VLAFRRIFGTDRGRQNDNLNGNPADVILTHMIALTDSPSKDDVGGPGNKAENQVYHTGSREHCVPTCIGGSGRRGESQLASGWRIYNELAETGPDLVRTMADDWIVDG